MARTSREEAERIAAAGGGGSSTAGGDGASPRGETPLDGISAHAADPEDYEPTVHRIRVKHIVYGSVLLLGVIAAGGTLLLVIQDRLQRRRVVEFGTAAREFGYGVGYVVQQLGHAGFFGGPGSPAGPFGDGAPIIAETTSQAMKAP